MGRLLLFGLNYAEPQRWPFFSQALIGPFPFLGCYVLGSLGFRNLIQLVLSYRATEKAGFAHPKTGCLSLLALIPALGFGQQGGRKTNRDTRCFLE